ncbi:DUF2126 domain-containing protein [Engelhardtia mirabilis]|uniref:Transglutaminase-like domain-containing protein n=1 Tax=Engelhardtia mirabilis TaxID=2528011 RepID=A0A518BGQ3_9BACT|nr:hypothetical protein Pla133_12020 [Planctomycetes bacterium Pla133]QDV00463.1 hypothetical protein Pla86_12020 [Planctomycetes bacterium Pla86]
MGIRVAINHKTVYRYDRSIRLGPQVVRLRPAPHCRTPILSYSLRAEPAKHFINWQQDPQSNYQARLVFPDKTRHLELEVDLVAELEVVNPFDFFLEPAAETYPIEYDEGLAQQLVPYLKSGPQGERFERYLAKFDRAEVKTIDFIVGFNQQVNADLSYVLRYEQNLQTPEETLELGRGACRDFAWLQVHLLRRLGFAARFASGYSVQLAPDIKSLDGPSGVSADIVDLHAWVEVYLPGAGWIGLDGTCGLMAGEGHIPLACSAEPEDAAPISGALDECEVEFEIVMTVERIAESPRHTRPYSEETWEQILECGAAVDRELERGDVRLTQGGEPTFVSIDDYVGEEWTTDALGDRKRFLSEELVRRLRERWSPGGALHYGQGKWYPGESLPRWALACYWRTDGEPLWKDLRWLAAPDDAGAAGADEAGEFARALAARLGAEVDHVIPAYEDPIYFAWREGKLPINLEPGDKRLEDPEERERMRRTFDRGLSVPVGWVLPIERVARGDGMVWRSELWMLRAQRVLLAPGDSPVGLRLPLGSLPWTPPSKRPVPAIPDPLEPRQPLPPREALGQLRVSAHLEPLEPGKQPEPETHGRGTAVPGEIRSALTVESRGGRVHVFLPPTHTLEDYVDLLASIEETAAELEQPVIVEGYEPPADPRLRVFKVTPDPGVIEVNVQPAASWDELVSITTELYEEARQNRLGTDKFMVDGRVVGTGGGNHVVMGGVTAADSPFLRRPHLLRSILGFWNNHPSLSYLFSSLFVGPTSQAPRIDESRADGIYELEIAFAQVPEEGPISPWIVDRIFRDLLVDSSGNTHRSEVCIDKLYSPDSSSGRLGLVEFRCFEMPAHGRMSLAQQLLLRAIIARFWDRPYRAPLRRWGTALHERFLLPWFCWRDLLDLLAEVSEGDRRLDPEWFRPHFEFRFPRIGAVQWDRTELELRIAQEPWNVTGEDPGGGGTVRYVDSSVERVQVRVTGFDESRYDVACNGVRVPLHSTGSPGEFVAGVRFRAWRPPRCLHPTIDVHAPLVFDLVDRWSGRAVAGCTYHVSHPGGRHHEEPPVNHLEAETRRRERFFANGHTPGPFEPVDLEPSAEFPLTLDLRRL